LSLIGIAETPSVFNALSQVTVDFIAFSFYEKYNVDSLISTICINLYFNVFFLFDFVFYFIILFLFFMKLHFDYLMLQEINRSAITLFYESIVYS
jgi:hypothetical protein